MVAHGGNVLKLSIVIPAFKASDTITATLASVFAEPLPDDWALEVMVVDDGSPDGDALVAAISICPAVLLFRLPLNQGKTKAMNHGITKTTGDIVMILDADDTLVRGWPTVFEHVVAQWPRECPVCFTVCRTLDGLSTVRRPEYSGRLSFEDILGERYSGEYLPMFWGDDLRREGGYRDPGQRWECLILTYLHFAKMRPLWISNAILRIYHVGRPGSVSDLVVRQDGAAGVSHCYDKVFEIFGDDYRRLAPRAHRRRRLRHAVFAAIAGDTRAMTLWRRSAHWEVPLETAVALLLVLSRGRLGLGLVRLGKRLGILRRFG